MEASLKRGERGARLRQAEKRGARRRESNQAARQEAEAGRGGSEVNSLRERNTADAHEDKPLLRGQEPTPHCAVGKQKRKGKTKERDRSRSRNKNVQ